MKSIKFSNVSGTIKAPASKSMMQRAIAASTLSLGESIIYNPSFCKDSLAACKIVKSLGAEIDISSNMVKIIGHNKPKDRHFFDGRGHFFGIIWKKSLATGSNNSIIISLFL